MHTMKLSVLDQSPIISGHSARRGRRELPRRGTVSAAGLGADFINAQGGEPVPTLASWC
jgi:hypothetical protein